MPRSSNSTKKILREYLGQGIDSEHRVSKLSLSNFCNPKSKFSSFPVLTGLKARQIRYLLPCVLAICKEEEQDAYGKTACLQNLESMYQCLDSGDMHFSESKRQRFRLATEKCLQHYTKCCKMCMEKKFPPLCTNTIWPATCQTKLTSSTPST